MTTFSELGFQRRVLHTILALIALAPGWRAVAGNIDTLTGLTPGHLIGCDYTFQNGDPSIPCAQDTAGAGGTVSSLKPNASFDNIEYFDVTAGTDIIEIVTPPNTPINPLLAPGDQYPLLQTGGAFTSFFDIFTDLSLDGFDDAGLELPGAITLGQTFVFTNGSSAGLPDVTIPGYTGTAVVSGFDVVSITPEPSTLMLFPTALGGLCLWRRCSAARRRFR